MIVLHHDVFDHYPQNYDKENIEFESKLILQESRKLCEELKERFQKEKREEEKEEEEAKRERELKNAFLPFGITDPVEADRQILWDLQEIARGKETVSKLEPAERLQAFRKCIQTKDGKSSPLLNIENYANSLPQSNLTKQELNEFLKKTREFIVSLRAPQNAHESLPCSPSNHDLSQQPKPGSNLIKSMPNLAQGLLEEKGPDKGKRDPECMRNGVKPSSISSSKIEGTDSGSLATSLPALHPSESDGNVTDTEAITATQGKENDTGTPAPSAENDDAESSTNFSLMWKALSTFAQTTQGKITIGVLGAILVAGILLAIFGTGGVAAGAVAVGMAIGAHSVMSISSGAGLVLGGSTLALVKYQFFGKAKQTDSETASSFLPQSSCKV